MKAKPKRKNQIDKIIKPTKKKAAKKSKIKWTQAEDFFIQHKVMDYNDKELAEILGKPEKEVVKHIKELGIDVEKLIAEKMHEKAMGGFAVGSGGDADSGKKMSDRQNIVSSTGGRSFSDDEFEKQNSGGNKYLEQFKTNIHRGK